MWNILLSRVIAVEGELRTQDNRLMGRLDMLFADVDSSGKLQGWVVADLKTGRAPDSQLKPEVQASFFTGIFCCQIIRMHHL